MAADEIHIHVTVTAHENPKQAIDMLARLVLQEIVRAQRVAGKAV